MTDDRQATSDPDLEEYARQLDSHPEQAANSRVAWAHEIPRILEIFDRELMRHLATRSEDWNDSQRMAYRRFEVERLLFVGATLNLSNLADRSISVEDLLAPSTLRVTQFEMLHPVFSGLGAALRRRLREWLSGLLHQAWYLAMCRIERRSLDIPSLRMPKVPASAIDAIDQAEAEVEPSRRSRVDKFLATATDVAGQRIWRYHIHRAAGHKQARQFQRWQKYETSATGADEDNFNRVLSMSPEQFIKVLKQRGDLPS